MEQRDDVAVFSTAQERKMKGHYIPKSDYQKASQVFHWAKREHYTAWFWGELRRDKRTEVMLPRLVKEGKLIEMAYSKRFVYSCPRRCRGVVPNIEHGLGCTEGLVRFWRSDMTGEIIPERYFRGFGIVPEWGIKFSESLLLFEFCTRDNASRSGLVNRKVRMYQEYLPRIEERFGGQGVVLFVLDIPREKIKPTGEFCFFVDYETFKSVPLGHQLTNSIYIWGGDGETYPLSHA